MDGTLKTKAVMGSLLFSMSGETNCMATMQCFFPSILCTGTEPQGDRLPNRFLRIPTGDPLVERDLEQHFFAMQRLYEQGDISQLEFAKAVICVFLDQATEERGLMDILCERCGIPVGGDIYAELLLYCLTYPALRNVPVLVVDISQTSIDAVSSSTDLCTNPHPAICQAVMAANNIEEMAEIFAQFDDLFAGEADQEIISRQAMIYRRASMFLMDLPRSILKLKIGEKEFCVPPKIFPPLGRTFESIQEAFRVFFNYLIRPEIERESELDELEGEVELDELEGGLGLDERNAFHVLKQVSLAWRGQNGVRDGHSLVNIPLMSISNPILLLKFDGVEIDMKFEDRDGELVLTEKVENGIIIGIKSMLTGNKPVTTEVRFKFSGDREIRTELPVTSVRYFPIEDDVISMEDNIIKWICAFRDDPPHQVIFYGGNQLVH
ncbi:MAG: hypothetical protein LBB05_04225 [Puniceicoccales bacterium]|jgi:hypothetical protein|nr:hypothetical protein [Puniceicoccales bacterium]